MKTYEITLITGMVNEIKADRFDIADGFVSFFVWGKGVVLALAADGVRAVSLQGA